MRRRKRDEEVLPSGPPDSEAVRQQQVARRAAERRQLEAFLKNKILPRVNAALRSEERISYLGKGKELSVVGSENEVIIYEVSGEWQWIEPLLKMLRSGSYRGYTIKLMGRQGGTGIGHRFKLTDLDEKNLEKSVNDFHARRPRGSVTVVISL